MKKNNISNHTKEYVRLWFCISMRFNFPIGTLIGEKLIAKKDNLQI